MKFKFLPVILLLVLLNSVTANCQSFFRLSGNVKDEHGQALPGATIFLSGTQFATSADDKGVFALDRLPAGSYKMILKMLGYELYTRDITLSDKNIDLVLTLKPASTQLKEVVIRPQKNRRKYLKLFTQQFLGTSENAAECRLTNPEVLDLDFNKKSKTLTAEADDPLIVVNKALGYQISYYLRKFSYDQKSGSVDYDGYPLFEELPATDRSKNWQLNRDNAFQGSLQHFITSLYTGTWQQQGFYLLTFKNLNRMGLQNNSRLMSDTKLIRSDSLLAKRTNGTVTFYSNDPVYVVYTKKGEQPEYREDGYSITGIFKDQKFYEGQASILTFNKPVKIDKQGNYLSTNDMLINGYLGWLRVADILPFGYKE